MKKIFLVLIIFAFISGCAKEKEEKPQIIGGKDSYGCIPGAGYTWCEKKHKCLRVWEEKCE